MPGPPPKGRSSHRLVTVKRVIPWRNTVQLNQPPALLVRPVTPKFAKAPNISGNKVSTAIFTSRLLLFSLLIVRNPDPNQLGYSRVQAHTNNKLSRQVRNQPLGLINGGAIASHNQNVVGTCFEQAVHHTKVALNTIELADKTRRPISWLQ